MIRAFLSRLFSLYRSPFRLFDELKEEGDATASLAFAIVCVILAELLQVDTWIAVSVAPGEAMSGIIEDVLYWVIVLALAAALFTGTARLFRKKPGFGDIFTVFAYCAGFFILLALINNSTVLIGRLPAGQPTAFTVLVVVNAAIIFWVLYVITVALRGYTGLPRARFFPAVILFCIVAGIVVFAVSLTGFGIRIVLSSLFI